MYHAEVAQTDLHLFCVRREIDPAIKSKSSDWLSQYRLSELLIMKYYKILTKKNNSFL